MFVLILLFLSLGATLATKPEFLVTKEKMLVALATVSVAISSPVISFTVKLSLKGYILIVFKLLESYIFFLRTGSHNNH